MVSHVALVRHNNSIDRRGLSEELFIRGSERFTTAENQQHEVGDAPRLAGARNALGLDDVERFSPPGGVDERNRDAADAEALGDEIARRAWNGCDDRTFSSS